MVLLRHVARKLAEQQRYIVFPFAQRRQVYAYLVKTVVEVLAEASTAHSLDDIHVSGGNHTHVNLLRRAAAHRYYLAVLQHAQQLHLHGQRQLAYFVEENGAAVGLFKITFARTVGASEGTFHMTEKLTLNGAFRYGTAVDGDESPALPHMFAQAVLVDDARKYILTHTTLAGDENAQVGGGHLYGLVEGQHQARIVAYYIVALFQCLYVHTMFSVQFSRRAITMPRALPICREISVYCFISANSIICSSSEAPTSRSRRSAII